MTDSSRHFSRSLKSGFECDRSVLLHLRPASTIAPIAHVSSPLTMFATTRWIPVRAVLERACAIVMVGSSRVSLNSYGELKSVLTSTWRLGRRSSRYCKPENMNHATLFSSAFHLQCDSEDLAQLPSYVTCISHIEMRLSFAWRPSEGGSATGLKGIS
jgi:hypothetical protein